MPYSQTNVSLSCSGPVFIILCFGGLALLLRLIFVNEVIIGSSPTEIVSFDGDSTGYLRRAHNLVYLVYNDTYAVSDHGSRSMVLMRTPG